MNKIPFEDGQLVKAGYVNIKGEKYDIVEPIYNGTVPINAETLNLLQANIEEAINEANTSMSEILKTTTNELKKTQQELKKNIQNILDVLNAMIIGELPEIYYSYDGIKATQLENNQSINSASISYRTDNIESAILIKDGEQIVYEVGQMIDEEGTYSIKLKKIDGTVTAPLIFKIDNTAPIVTGIETTVIRETIIIRFMNFDDVVSAILTTQNGDIDLYALANEGKLEQDENGRYIYTIEYTEENKGQYYLEVKDAAGNETYRNFRIR